CLLSRLRYRGGRK
ncbi:hypothetical protein D046_4493B, partial [Vibrio parahaemolyticus V-223/04]